MKYKNILLDTSFFIRLLKDDDPLHPQVKEYFRTFLTEGTILWCSTISIAEYCVKGTIGELPLHNLRILPFNINHAQQAGPMARLLFEQRSNLEGVERVVIPNDAKLFAQAQSEQAIDGFATADKRCLKIYYRLAENQNMNFTIINVRNDLATELQRLL
ncbi:MAG: hypothetical protein IPM61_09865 [Chlorobi bacterium]|nr:MAG: hypothetical protein UZ07_CHB004000503 [Chlorobi bacterium OLB7]MBK8911620.1 hypothetical protein [Chlorobiota bacterium]MBX7215689.1 hypothetical protein [Candidatus Kapabacteria bacterium]